MKKKLAILAVVLGGFTVTSNVQACGTCCHLANAFNDCAYDSGCTLGGLWSIYSALIANECVAV